MFDSRWLFEVLLLTLHSKVSADLVLQGLAISPLVASAFVVVGLLAYSGLAPFANVFGGFMVIAFHGYACELVYGLPLYFLIKRNASLSAWHLLCLGAIAGAVVALLSALVMFPARGISLAEGIAASSVRLVPFGTVVGLVVWCYAARRRSPVR
jgi:hypothetical protein